MQNVVNFGAGLFRTGYNKITSPSFKRTCIINAVFVATAACLAAYPILSNMQMRYKFCHSPFAIPSKEDLCRHINALPSPHWEDKMNQYQTTYGLNPCEPCSLFNRAPSWIARDIRNFQEDTVDIFFHLKIYAALLTPIAKKAWNFLQYIRQM